MSPSHPVRPAAALLGALLFMSLRSNAVPLTLSLTASDYNGYNVSCNGAQDGSIDLTISGGVAPYTISWSNKETTEDISGLSAGYYSVGVVDANGDRAEEEITLTEPLEMKAGLTVSSYSNGYNISCFECSNGTLSTTVQNGIAPFSYVWKDGPTTANRWNLGPKDYGVEVTDANGCTDMTGTVLTGPDRSDWTMGGNTGTDPATQYIGTSDNKDVVFKTNAAERLRLLGDGTIKLSGLSEGILKIDPNGLVAADPMTETFMPNKVAPYWRTSGNYLNTAVPNDAFVGSIDNEDLRFRTNNTERMVLTAGGRLGVGTSPESDIHFHHTGAKEKMILSSTTDACELWLRNDMFGYAFSIDEAGRGHILQNYNDPAPLMTFDDGRVMIGDVPQTASQDYALFVAKGVLTEKVQVKLVENWPDFVFNPSYHLQPLSEVEQYIKMHGHLPDIPSAADAEKDGVDLGKSNELLLKKVEELTLYVIQLEKRVNELEGCGH